MEALRDQMATSLKAGFGIVSARLMQQPLWQTAAAVLAAVVGARLLLAVAGWARRIAVLSSIPSPSGAHPLMGHMKQIASSKHHKTLLRWTEELGPMYLLKVLWMRVVVVSDPVLVHTLLRKNPDADKSQKSYGMLNDFMGDKGYGSIFTASTHSPHWRAVRKGASPAFSPKALRNGFPQIQRTAQELLAVVGRRAEAAQTLDLDRLMMRETLDVLGRVAFGVDFQSVNGFEEADRRGRAAEPEEETDVFNIIESLLHEVNKLLGNPLRRYMWWDKEVRRCRRYNKVFLDRMMDVVTAIKRDAVKPENSWSMAAHMLRVEDPIVGGPLSDERLIPEICSSFVAGMHTTAHSMTWTVYLISTHPEVEAKVCEELHSLGLLATPDNPNPRQIEYEDLNKLPYLTAANKEAMRLKPVGADGTAIDFRRDVEIGGHTVPAGTVFWLPFHSTFNSKHYWELPDKYLPERWLVPGTEYALPPGAAAKANAEAEATGIATYVNGSPSAKAERGKNGRPSGTTVHVHAGEALPAGAAAPAEGEVAGGGGRPLRFFPFSQGPRDCIGLSLAKLNYTATLASLLGRYHFQLTPEMTTPGGVEDCEIVEMALHPSCGLHATPIPRASMTSATDA